MDTRRNVIELRLKGYTYSKIAKELSISRQRAHQIVTGYTTLGSKNPYGLRRKPCFVCKKSSKVIHHKDRNSHNNKLKNLISLCYPCHVNIHWPGYLRPNNCKDCNLSFKKDNYHAGGRCKDCWGKFLALNFGV